MAVKRAMLAAAGAGVLLCACGGPKAPQAPAASTSPSPQSDYTAPPELTAAARMASGAVQLSGVGPADATVRLASPDGSAIGVQAGRDGRWTLAAPAGPEPRLYSLSEDLAGRLVRARGYIAVLPPPGPPAAVVRPGVAAEPIDGARGLRIGAVDFDRSSAAVVSGQSRPGEVVRLTLDGADAGEDRADGRGVFSVSLSRALRAGPHVVAVQAGRSQATAAFTAGPAQPILTPPLASRRDGAAWRIDWMTPGGGIQSTILFDSGEAVR